MVKDKLKNYALTAFTSNGDYLAILSPNGTAKIWSTNNGDLLAQWKPSDGDPDTHYSCIAFSFIGKKHRKEQGTCLLALGTVDGSVLAIDVFTGERKRTTSHPGGVVGLSFANRGRLLRVVGLNGIASEINTKTGKLLKEFKISKNSISSLAFSHDEKYLAIVGTKVRIISWEIGKEVLKVPNDLGNAQYVSISSDSKALVTSDVDGKHLQVWRCDLNSGTVSSGPTLSVKHPPFVFECRYGCNEEDDLVVLAISSSGTANVWNLKASSEDEIKPIKITVKINKVENDKQNSASPKKNCASIIASKLQPVGVDKQMRALVAHGSLDHPQFSFLNLSNSGENIILDAANETETVQEGGSSAGKAVPKETKKSKKRQAVSDPDLLTTADKVDLELDVDQGEAADGVLLDDDMNEPTMGEKLASLNLLDENKSNSNKEQESSVVVKPPSADSIQVLLKQALNADDRALLLECLYMQDKKVITKSISQLNPSNVLKLLHSLISIIESRGAILACALPWLKSLLLQHASGIMSQESSLQALNSLYQLIESRVSTFKSAVQLSSCLDVLYPRVIDEEVEESLTVPAIYEDEDDSEEDSENAMETDQDSKDEEQSDNAFDDVSDIEESDDMMSE